MPFLAGLLARTFTGQLTGGEIMQRLLAGLPRRDGRQHRIPDAATWQQLPAQPDREHALASVGVPSTTSRRDWTLFARE
jgi:hypothetical protein